MDLTRWAERKCADYEIWGKFFVNFQVQSLTCFGNYHDLKFGEIHNRKW